MKYESDGQIIKEVVQLRTKTYKTSMIKIKKEKNLKKICHKNGN